MDDERLIDIESKLSHQEHLLTELNAVLTGQQAQITRLEALCETLIERLRSVAENESPTDPTNERPPHY